MTPVVYISGGVACAVAGVAFLAWRVLRRTRPYTGLVQVDEVQLAVTELAPLATKHDPAAPEVALVVEGTIEEVVSARD